MKRHNLLLYDLESFHCPQHPPQGLINLFKKPSLPCGTNVFVQRNLLPHHITPHVIVFHSALEQKACSTVNALRQMWGKIPLMGLLCPNDTCTEESEQTLASELDDYLLCPFQTLDLAPKLRRLLARRNDSSIRSLPNSAGSNDSGHGPLIGPSAAIATVRSQIEKVSRSDCSVLITGETGTGKELVARSIHDHSSRSCYPFVSINCAAIPESLIESELFGFEPGAFTGATHAHPGQLQMAHKGTVFLDEIGDMNLSAQAKVLRVLEDRQIRPLAGRTQIPLDIRIISATNQDLEQLIACNRFRKDLLYRLNVMQIQLPPLCDRKEDIADLGHALLTRLCHREGRLAPTLTAEALHCLEQYPWPGNVRELRNVLEASLLNSSTDAIGRDDLPLNIQRHSIPNGSLALDERDRLQAALALTKWNKSQAAKRLDWSRMTLYRKLHKYKIPRNEQEC